MVNRSEYRANQSKDRSDEAMKKSGIYGPLLALGIFASACGSSQTTTSAATPSSSVSTTQPQSVVKVTIENFAFVPSKLVVKSGGEILVTNNDSVIHTFTATDKSFNSGNILPGKTVAVKVGSSSTSASISYMCSIHQYMTGSITIVP